MVSCTGKKKEDATATTAENFSISLNKEAFDTVLNGRKVGLYFLDGKNIHVAITNYGARIVGLWVPDKNGRMTDVVVGFSSVKAYLRSKEAYYGAIIGRVANRIARGTFVLNGKEYHLPHNNGANTLHGGKRGFQDVVWKVTQPNKKTLVLLYHSPDGSEGFPGNLLVKVIYSITNDNTLKIDFEAHTDRSTLVNLTNHAFFNLNGEGSGDILNHLLFINAKKYTPINSNLIPTGELEEVEKTPFDFTVFHTIGERIEVENKQLINGKGYDHNYVLSEYKASKLQQAAKVIGDKSGIFLDVYTLEPGLQFYSGNFMKEKNTFKSGIKDKYRTAFCLETQHFPDSPNQPNFPSIILEKGQVYHTVTEFRFGFSK